MDRGSAAMLGHSVASRVLRALFVVYVLATALHIGFVVAHEPFAYDAWIIAWDTRAEPFSFDGMIDYGTGQYLNSNPRVGQWFAYLAYKLEHFAIIATPIAFLALALAVSVLGLGRWPRWSRGRDLALVAVVIGCLWFALPRLGMLLFCRSYATNYVYGAAIQLLFLVPLRLRARPLRTATPAVTIPYFVFGVIAGMCNEHTGPTLALFALGYATWRTRTTGQRPNLAWAGALGVVVGFAAIFFAPGQGDRYDGIAEQVGFLRRLASRAVTGNLDIYRDYLISAAPVLAMIAVALVISRSDGDTGPRRSALARVGLALVAGSLITATLFVSPKLGWRFYLHSCALLLGAFIAVADSALITGRRLAPFVALAVVASIYAGVKTIPMYMRLAEASDARLAVLEAAPEDSVVTLDSLTPVDDAWWFLGDDLRHDNKREMVATYFGLTGLVHRAIDVEAPLGLTDVRFRAHVALDPPALGDAGGLELGDDFRGMDVKAVHGALAIGIAALQQRIAGRGALQRVELEVGFVGAPPAGLPARRLLVARWTPERFEGWAASIGRRGFTPVRTIRLPKELAGTDAEIFIYQVGAATRRLGTARDPLEYREAPITAAYWVLACPPASAGDDTPCFVIAATRRP